jgi:hypothetical protein
MLELRGVDSGIAPLDHKQGDLCGYIGEYTTCRQRLYIRIFILKKSVEMMVLV